MKNCSTSFQVGHRLRPDDVLEIAAETALIASSLTRPGQAIPRPRLRCSLWAGWLAQQRRFETSLSRPPTPGATPGRMG
jgi:hypothetical protein